MSNVLDRIGELSPERLEVLRQKLSRKVASAGTAISRRTGGERLAPLSYSQERLWFIDQLWPGSSAYNMPGVLRLEGALCLEALRATLAEIVRRQETLRTRFPAEDGMPRQEVLDAGRFHLSEVDLSGLEKIDQEWQTGHLVEQDSQRPFDLSRGLPFRATLVRLTEREHVLATVTHHIGSDGWSMGIFSRETEKLYEAFAGGRASSLLELGIQYGDYSAWQRKTLSGNRLAELLAYWRERLSGAPPLLELPTDRARHAGRASSAGNFTMRTGPEVSSRLKDTSRRQGATLYMTALAAFAVMLFKYSGQEDVVIGTPIAGRQRKEFEELIGFFVNTLVLRVRMQGNPTFGELLERVRAVCLGAYSHQEMPFEKLVEELHPERSLSHTPIFQVMFLMQNAPKERLGLRGLRVKRMPAGGGSAKFDLEVAIGESRDALWCEIEYSPDLFDEAAIARMGGHFLNILDSAAKGSNKAAKLLSMLGEAERDQIIGWAKGERRVHKSSWLHECIELQADSRRDGIAVDCEGSQLSYRELNRLSNQLGWRLRELGVGLDRPVGIFSERSSELVLGLVGILKAGGAFVPLEPSYPVERLEYFRTESGAQVVVASRGRANGRGASALSGKLVELEDVIGESTENTIRDENLGVRCEGDNLAYIIYTSGSTGRPKGAMNTHRGIENRVSWMQDEYRLEPGEGVLQKTPISFDVSVWEFFWPLTMGGRLILARPEGHRDSAYLAGLIKEKNISTVHFVPSMLETFLAEDGLAGCESLKRVICSGEALSWELMKTFRADSTAELHNLYGPTEAAIDVTKWQCEEAAESVRIGRPIANVTTHVLDDSMELTPEGVAGELYLGGVGVARGYKGRPEMTAERFVPDGISGESGRRLYRTGDVARWRRDGNLECLGRKDYQVKVRGYRIELGEIEGGLREHEAVTDAVVVVREDIPGDKRLVGYVLREQGAEITGSELRTYLRDRLPEYMVPGAIVELERMPLMANGKLDRNALPAPEYKSKESQEEAEAATPLEEMIAGIYGSVLGVETVSVADDFFELGGHSLLATQVISRVRKAFGVELPLRTIFEAPSVRALAGAVAVARSSGVLKVTREIKAVSRQGSLALSYGQQRLWFIDQLEPGSSLYNMPTALRLEGQLSLTVLEQSLTEVVRRHEVLRTRFGSTEGEAYQVIGRPRPVSVEQIDVTGVGEAEEVAKVLAREEGEAGFDLSRGRLMRVKVVKVRDGKHLLLLTMHHIVSDGWSTGILVRELSKLYEGFLNGDGSWLEELDLQYADYALWQRQWMRGDVLEDQMRYWRERLCGVSPLDLSADYERPAVATHRGAAVGFLLRPELTEDLKEMSRREGVTLFMTLLAGLQVLLSRYSGQRDIAVGTPIANRNRLETEALIGFFVNTLVLRSEIRGEMTFGQLLGEVRDGVLGAYEHQDVPFEKVVEELQPQRDLSRTPLFQTVFVLQNNDGTQLKMPGLSLGALQGVQARKAKFELTVDLRERYSGVGGVIEYSTDLFAMETIERMAGHLQMLLEGIAADPQQNISSIQVLPERERQQILGDWNGTTSPYPREKCIHQVFEEVAARTPDAVAVIYDEEVLTYAELNRRANQLSSFLKDLGVGPEVRVGVCIDRSIEMVIGLLGILKAGAAYLPLDPATPTDRMSFLRQDAQVAVLLTQQRLTDELRAHWSRLVCLDADWSEIQTRNIENSRTEAIATNLAYVMYTSGSTGQPKGTAVVHRGVVRLVKEVAYVDLGPDSVMIQAAPLAFDASTFEIWGVLLNGGRLAVLRAGAPTLEDIGRTVKDERPTTLWMTAGLFHLMVDEKLEDLSPVRQLLAGGDVVSSTHVNKLYRELAETTVINGYGPTECTTFSCCHTIVREDLQRRSIPIGRAIANTQIYALDKEFELAPVGGLGELHIGGDGLSRGYLNEPGLTAERFMPNPFSSEAGRRLYRTGDKGRYSASGHVEFLGRNDNQTKIRGYRVEMAEIELALGQHPQVRESVALACDAPGGKVIVAYVLGEEGAGINVNELREYLKKKLPVYMVPTRYVLMERMPLTSNGKVDRKALPAEDGGTRTDDEGYVPPRTTVEEILCGIWGDLLHLDRVGVRDSFFDLGGHSMLAVRLIARIEKQFGVRLGLSTLIEEPTVEHLAKRLERPESIKSLRLPVAIQDGGSLRPFFCVHPVGGHVLRYKELAQHLGPDQPFYGFQARGLDDDQAPHDDVRSMAADYLSQMLSIQPKGPYSIGGWSFGGIVAFEMAQQLRERGDEVALLALLDPTNPKTLPDSEDEGALPVLLHFAQDLGIPRKRLREFLERRPNMALSDQLSEVLSQARAWNLLPTEVELPRLVRHFEIFKTNLSAARRYVAHPYPGHLNIFRARERLPNDFSDQFLGWGELAGEGLELHAVAGNHSTMVSEPHVKVLAAELGKCLRLSMHRRNNLFASVVSREQV
jgi:amino acid adenylation domain-containing protein